MTKKDVEKVIERLKQKVAGNGKMPSIVGIHNLLDHYGIEHEYRETENIVEYRSAGCRYVNSRHTGKKGYKIYVRDPYIGMDTSDSYYSFNSWNYAEKILKLIKQG